MHQSIVIQLSQGWDIAENKQCFFFNRNIFMQCWDYPAVLHTDEIAGIWGGHIVGILWRFGDGMDWLYCMYK